MSCCARQMGLFSAFMLQTNVIDCFIDSSDCGYSALPPTIIALRVSELPLAPKPADGFPAGSLALPHQMFFGGCYLTEETQAHISIRSLWVWVAEGALLSSVLKP